MYILNKDFLERIKKGLLFFSQCLDYFIPKHMGPKIFANHLKPVVLVFIG